MKDEAKKHEKSPDSLQLLAARVLVNESEWTDEIDTLYQEYIDENITTLEDKYNIDKPIKLDCRPFSRIQISEALEIKLKILTSKITKTTNIPIPHFEVVEYVIQERYQARYVIDSAFESYNKDESIDLKYELTNHKIDIKKSLSLLSKQMKFNKDNTKIFELACYLGFDDSVNEWLDEIYHSDLDFESVSKLFTASIYDSKYVDNFRMPPSLIEEGHTYDDIMLEEWENWENWEDICELENIPLLQAIYNKVDREETFNTIFKIFSHVATRDGNETLLKFCFDNYQNKNSEEEFSAFFRQTLTKAVKKGWYSCTFKILDDEKYPEDLRTQIKDDIVEQIQNSDAKTIASILNRQNINDIVESIFPLLSKENVQLVIIQTIEKHPRYFKFKNYLKLYPFMNSKTEKKIKYIFNENKPDTLHMSKTHSYVADDLWNDLLEAHELTNLFFGKKAADEYYTRVCNPARIASYLTTIDVKTAIDEWNLLDNQLKSDCFAPVLYYLCDKEYTDPDNEDKELLIDCICKDMNMEMFEKFIQLSNGHFLYYRPVVGHCGITSSEKKYFFYWLLRYSPKNFFNSFRLDEFRYFTHFQLSSQNYLTKYFEIFLKKFADHPKYTEFDNLKRWNFTDRFRKDPYNQNLFDQYMMILTNEIKNFTLNKFDYMPYYIRYNLKFLNNIYFSLPSNNSINQVFDFFLENARKYHAAVIYFFENLLQAYQSKEDNKTLILCELIKNCLSDRPNNPILRNRDKGGFALKGFFKHRNPIDGKICQSKAELKLIDAYYSLKNLYPEHFPKKPRSHTFSK